MLKPTGERVIPELQRGELVYAEHLVRYRLASQLAEGRRVLDVGSGEGYGTAMLAAAGAATAVGIDVDAQTIEHAVERYGPMFRAADATRLPFEDDSFDLVVCFETIEHLDDDAAAIRELRRVLAPDGVLVISTPNGDEYLVENEFHKREYAPAEFDDLLAEHFPERLWLYQQNWLLSAVLDATTFSRGDDEADVDVDLVKVVGAEPGRELYSVVICGARPDEVTATGVITAVFEANRMSQELAKIPELKDQLDAWIDRAGKAEHLRDVYEQRGDELQEQATSAAREVDAWVERSGIAEARVSELENQVAELENAIEEIEASFSWRLTKPLRAVKGVLRR